jgi:predicted membrane protein
MHGLFFGGLFWGLLISLIGISIILKYVLNIDLHLGSIFFGIILILFGLNLIFGHAFKPTVKHHQRVNYYSGTRDHNILFSSGTIDLTNYSDDGKFPGEINVVFGSAGVLVPDSLNLIITTTTVFGSTNLPDRSYNGFGEDTFILNNNPAAPQLKLETNTVFGKLDFEIVPTNKSKASMVVPDTTTTKVEESF